MCIVCMHMQIYFTYDGIRSQLNSSCSRHKILFEWFPRCCIECKEYLKMHNDNIQCAKCRQRQYNIFVLRAKRWAPTCGCYSVRCCCCFFAYTILLIHTKHTLQMQTLAPERGSRPSTLAHSLGEKCKWNFMQTCTKYFLFIL